jgi:hypothetical protein
MKLFGKTGILGKRTFVRRDEIIRRDEIRSRDLDQAKFCDRIYLLSLAFLENGVTHRAKLPNLGNVHGCVSIAVPSSAFTPFHLPAFSSG